MYAPMPQRRAIRLRGYDYSQPGEYFATIVTKDRERILGTVVDGAVSLSEFGEIVAFSWKDLPNHYPSVILDEFIVMPDHVHGIIAITEPDPVREPSPTKRYPLSEIVRGFKTFSAKRINEIRGTPGLPVWQRDYFEHIIRDERSLGRIREYIVSNPSKWLAEVSTEVLGMHDKLTFWIKQEGSKLPGVAPKT